MNTIAGRQAFHERALHAVGRRASRCGNAQPFLPPRTSAEQRVGAVMATLYAFFHRRGIPLQPRPSVSPTSPMNFSRVSPWTMIENTTTERDGTLLLQN